MESKEKKDKGIAVAGTIIVHALIVLVFRRKGDGLLNRIAGAILLAVYIGYLALLIVQAT